jgi:hypothetical protein
VSGWLFEVRRGRVLWIIPTTRVVYTPSGEEARAELQRWLAVGTRRLSGWADSDPSHALAYAGMAGAALLLMPELFPQLHRLRDQPRTYDADGGLSSASAVYPASDRDDEWNQPGEVPGLELSSLDLSGFDFGSLDFGAFAGLDAAMSAIDAGVDWGGGDAGGGGGGGDGGGGGGEA